MTIKNSITAPLVIIIATSAMIMGCSKPSSSGASGGDTSCKEFLTLDKDGKNATIETYLAGRGQSTSKANIMATRLSAEAFCRTTGKDKYVKNIETG